MAGMTDFEDADLSACQTDPQDYPRPCPLLKIHCDLLVCFVWPDDLRYDLHRLPCATVKSAVHRPCGQPRLSQMARPVFFVAGQVMESGGRDANSVEAKAFLLDAEYPAEGAGIVADPVGWPVLAI